MPKTIIATCKPIIQANDISSHNLHTDHMKPVGCKRMSTLKLKVCMVLLANCDFLVTVKRSLHSCKPVLQRITWLKPHILHTFVQSCMAWMKSIYCDHDTSSTIGLQTYHCVLFKIRPEFICPVLRFHFFFSVRMAHIRLSVMLGNMAFRVELCLAWLTPISANPHRHSHNTKWRKADWYYYSRCR